MLHRDKATVSLILFLSISSMLFCLEPLPYASPQDLCLGILTPLSDNPSAAVINPAAGQKGFSSSLQYISSMSELPLYGLHAVLGGKTFSVLSGVRLLDAQDYTAQDYTVGGGWQLGWLRLGASYNAMFDRIAGYNSTSQSFCKAGLVLDTGTTRLDAVAENLLPSRRTAGEILPESSFCLAQWLAPVVQSGFGVTLYKHQAPTWRFSTRTFIYSGWENILTWQNNPSQYAFCTVFSVKRLQVSYTVKTHPELTWTQAIGLSYKLP